MTSAPPQQLWLIPWENPLTGRIGRAFFARLPQNPGVYRFLDAGGQVLYVGQSKNLRQRLNSYRYLKPGRASRKLLRLVHRAAKIDFETCLSTRAARLRENELIRKYRPTFNAANSHPESHIFIMLRLAEPASLRWSRGHSPAWEPGCHIFGSFRSTSGSRGLLALMRLLHVHLSPIHTVFALPSPLSRDRAPLDWPLPQLNRRLARKLLTFLAGKDDSLVNRLCGQNGQQLERIQEPCLRRLLLQDRTFLIAFFNRAAQRNRLFHEQFHAPRREPIAPPALDDFFASGQSEK